MHELSLIAPMFRGTKESDVLTSTELDTKLMTELGKALMKHYDNYGKIDAREEPDSVYEFFRNMPVGPPYSSTCQDILLKWRSQYGEEIHPTSLRNLLQEADGGTKGDAYTQALKDRATLHSCGHEILLPSALLFRGTGREKAKVEEFTATSMSFRAAMNYMTPISTTCIQARTSQCVCVCMCHLQSCGVIFFLCDQ